MIKTGVKSHVLIFSSKPFLRGCVGIFSILRPLNDILLVSYDFLESIKVLKWKVKNFFSKGPPFGYFQKIQKVL